MELFYARWLSKSQIRVTRELYMEGKMMNRVSSCSMVLSFVLLLLFGVVSVSASRSYGLAGEANVSISSTSTIFSEGFEWTFPEPNWVVADANTDNGGDYWDDTSIKSHSGNYSAWCAQIGSQVVGETIWTEDFEGEFPGFNWTVADWDYQNYQDCWDDTSYRSHGGGWSAWCAQIGTQIVDSVEVPNSQVHKYDDFMSADARRKVDPSGLSSLQELGYTSATLSYSYWLDCDSNFDFLIVDYRVHIEPHSTKIITYTGNSGGWQTVTVNVPIEAIDVGFRFDSDYYNRAEGAYVDDVVLTGYKEVPNYQVGHYDDNMEAGMLRQLDLTSYASVTLSYWYWVDAEQSYDHLKVLCTGPGGSIYLDPHTGNSGGWQYSEVSIPTTAYEVGFIFRSDSANHGYEGAFVDDVMLVGTEKPGILEGNAYDVYKSNPLEGVNVTVGGQSSLTDTSGYYQFELEPGTYEVSFQIHGYYNATVPGIEIRSNMTSTLDRWLMPIPTVESCDVNGARKDSFDGADTVYMSGSGYTPFATYDVCIVNDTAWVDGMSIPQRVSGTILSMTLDASGDIKPIPIWFPPLALGKYDVVVDVNNNSKYDLGIDALDSNDVQGTAGFIVTEQEMWKLIISVVGSGITEPVPGVHMFTNGTEAPVNATPNAGWIFDHWVLDGISIEWMNPISITMGRDRDLTVIFVGAPPVVESCDRTGAQKDLFNNTEPMYVNGTGYGQLAGADIYIVEDTTWTDGMTIPARVPNTVNVVNSDWSGNILPTAVWNPPLTVGRYDVCVDVNRNGRYDQGVDALDDNEIQATAGYQVVPEFRSFFILLFFIVATLLAVRAPRKRARGAVA
jgi:hypothetical protein